MKVPLLEYLDKLEAVAKRSADGPGRGWWHIERCGSSGLVGIVCDDEDYNPIAETLAEIDAAHILATQPSATLALIAKLREAVGLFRQATAAAMYPGVGAGAINRFQDDVVAWASIEVPE